MFWNLIYQVTSGSVTINYMCLRKSDEPLIHVKSLPGCRTLRQVLCRPKKKKKKKTLMSIYHVPSMMLVAGHSVEYCTQRSFPCGNIYLSIFLYLNQCRKCISFSDYIFRSLKPKTVHLDLLSVFCFSGHQFPWPVHAVQCSHQQLIENARNTCLRYRWSIFACDDALGN